MALPTVEVFDDILMPNGAALGGSLRFILSAVDVDLDSGIVPPREVTIPLPADGSFTVDLWPNDAGTRGTSYQVFVVLPRVGGSGNAESLLGTFALTSSPSSQRLGPMLDSPTVLATVALSSIAAITRKVEEVEIVAKTADYTLATTDKGKLIEVNSANPVTLTIPTDAAGSWETNAFISITKIGTGALNITAASGVTLNGVSAGSAELLDQWGACHVWRRSANAWAIVGGIGGVA